MSIIKKTIGGVLTAAIIMTYGAELGELLDIPGADQLVPTVEARIGRPLTPVSVAGVARRTVRRCAVGVYHCSLPDFQPLDSLAGLVNTRPGGLTPRKGV